MTFDPHAAEPHSQGADPDDLDTEATEEVHARDLWLIARFPAPFARPYRRPLLLLGLVLLVETVFNFSFPLAAQHLVDGGLIERNSRVLVATLAFLGAAG